MILTKECEYCGKDFKYRKWVKYPASPPKCCSQTCHLNRLANKQRKRIKLQCIICNKSFDKTPSRIDRVKDSYCSNKCKFVGHSNVMKGRESWNKGKPAPWAIIPKPRYGKENNQWRGDDVGYHGLHIWVKKHFGQPTTCEYCGEEGLKGHKIHWANKDHTYKRNLNDWLRLCVPCHSKYDKKLRYA